MDEEKPLSEAIEEVLVKILRKDLLDQYLAEKIRHRAELRDIDTAMKRARNMLKRLFGKLKVTRTEELEAEYLERVQGENDRHADWLNSLRETIRDHVNPSRHEEEGV